VSTLQAGQSGVQFLVRTRDFSPKKPWLALETTLPPGQFTLRVPSLW